MNTGVIFFLAVIELVLIFCVVKIEQNTRDTSTKLSEIKRLLEKLTDEKKRKISPSDGSTVKGV